MLHNENHKKASGCGISQDIFEQNIKAIIRALNANDLIESLEAFKKFGLSLRSAYPGKNIDGVLGELKGKQGVIEYYNIHNSKIKLKPNINLMNLIVAREAADQLIHKFGEIDDPSESDAALYKANQAFLLATTVFSHVVGAEHTNTLIKKIDEKIKQDDDQGELLEQNIVSAERIIEAQSILMDTLQKNETDKDDLGLEVDKAFADLKNPKRKPSPEQKILEKEIAKLSHMEEKIKHYVENELDESKKKEFQVDAYIVKTITKALQTETARYFNLANPKEADLERLKEKWDVALNALNQTHYVKNHPLEEQGRERRVKTTFWELIRKLLKRIGLKDKLFSEHLSDARITMTKVEAKQRRKLK